MMWPTLEPPAADSHGSAQWLLSQGLLAGGTTYAEVGGRAAPRGPTRLLRGYASNSVWTTRQVLHAISPHVDDELFERLEAAVRDLHFLRRSVNQVGAPSICCQVLIGTDFPLWGDADFASHDGQ
jgi:hypothetical protein